MGKRISGIEISYAAEYRYQKEKAKEKAKNNEDTENRKYIGKKVIEYIEKGHSFNDAIDLIMQDDIIQKFDYWFKNNLDIRQCVTNVAKGFIRKKEKIEQRNQKDR